MSSSIDMYDLPTEAELGKAMMEAAKQNIKVGEIDTKTIFPFWTPTRGGKNPHVVSDNTGAVKPKADMKRQSGNVMDDWNNFLSSIKTSGNKPVTETDNFGSVVVKSHAAKPDANKLVGSIKALKTTTVKEMSGKATTKTEELGVGKVITKSNAASPKANNLVGIVDPKAALGKQNKPEDYLKTSAKPTQATPVVNKVYNKYSDTIKPETSGAFAEYTTQSNFPTSKKQTTVVSDKTGVVKPKSALNGKK